MALSEFSWIATLLKPLATAPEALSLEDDAAFLPADAHNDWIVSTDTCVEGIHFLTDAPLELVVRKAFRSAFSDLAAMGARPSGYLMNFARPRTFSDTNLELVAGSLKEEQEQIGVALLGGDTVVSPGPLMLSFTVFGKVPKGQALRRSGAKPGDFIYTTGYVGESEIGLKVILKNPLIAHLDQKRQTEYVTRHFSPPQYFDFMDHARPLISAAIDTSDGLVADLGHIAHASQVSAEVELATVPFSTVALELMYAMPTMRESLLTGGEDYELIITVSPDNAMMLEDAAKKYNAKITKIGVMVSGETPGVKLNKDGEEVRIQCGGYVHF